MPAYTIQPSFSGGELAPSLHARVDLAKYSVGLKTCRNFIIQAHGGVSNRAGTKFICETKDSSKNTRLIPFEFNTEQTYILEFGHLTMRVIKDGGQVYAGASPVEIATPYSDSEIKDLNYTQSADVLTICHPSHQPRELARSSHTLWSITLITTGTDLSAPTGVSSTRQNYNSSLDSTSYQYIVTASDTSIATESMSSSSTSITNNNLTSTVTNTISWSGVSGADMYNVYKMTGGIFGFVGRSTGTSFVDNNIIADANDTPQINKSLFNSTDNYPAAVSYYQQRLIFAQTNNNPQRVYMSQTGNYHNFNISTPLKDDDAVTFTIASSQVNEIRHMVPLSDLVVLTSGGEWLMVPGDGRVVTPTSISIEPQGYRGASEAPPLVIGNTILYVQSKGSIIRDLGFNLDSDAYTGNDLTVLSNHLFAGKSIKEWAYSQSPHSIVWVVLDDGSVASLTYMREHEVWGWARHDTDGTFESVCSVAEGNEDATYFVVNRTIGGSTKRYIERLASRVIADVKDAFFVDSGLSYDGTHTAGTTSMTLSGGSTWKHTENLTLTASVSSTFVSGDVGNTIVLTIGTDTLVCTIKAYTSGTVVTVRAGRDVPTAFQSVATSTWAKGVDELSGLDHLEGETVSILADGSVASSKVVSSGAVSIDTPAVKIHIGLPIQADFQTLDLEDAQGTIQGKTKSISTITFRVENTRGGKVGPSSDNLTEFKQRAYENYGDPTSLKTGDIRVTIPSKWASSGSIFFRQDDPLPVTLLAVIPEVSVGG
jgi:hypothetical protein